VGPAVGFAHLKFLLGISFVLEFFQDAVFGEQIAWQLRNFVIFAKNKSMLMHLLVFFCS